jgi:hypothetical protein
VARDGTPTSSGFQGAAEVWQHLSRTSREISGNSWIAYGALGPTLGEKCLRHWPSGDSLVTWTDALTICGVSLPKKGSAN